MSDHPFDATDPYALKAHLSASGELIDNTLIAGRWPPGMRAPVHPDTFYKAYAVGGPIDKMKEMLPEPAPDLQLAFKQASPKQDTDSGSVTPRFDPKIII